MDKEKKAKSAYQRDVSIFLLLVFNNNIAYVQSNIDL